MPTSADVPTTSAHLPNKHYVDYQVSNYLASNNNVWDGTNSFQHIPTINPTQNVSDDYELTNKLYMDNKVNSVLTQRIIGLKEIILMIIYRNQH
jgi:hypothetical protein